MKSLCTSAILFSLFPLSLVCQMQNPPAISAPADAGVAAGGFERVTLMGKVISEDGRAPDERGAVVLMCGTDERARVPLDTQGTFSMTIQRARYNSPDPTSMDPSGSEPLQTFADCELSADITGYRSESIHLMGNNTNLVQVGSIIVHSVSADHAFSVSVTSLEAPKNAREAFQKGKEQERKGKWAAACDYFRRAIQEYPRYALAWLELGRAQAQQNSFVAAQQSFHQAVSQDSHLVDGYVELARVALQQKQWKDLAEATEHILQAFPNASAQYWLLNAVAHFNTGEKSRAETSAARGLLLDTKHSFPQLEYLYGLALANRHDYKGAIDHLRAYLHLAPKAADAAQAQAQFQQLQKLVDRTPESATASTNPN